MGCNRISHALALLLLGGCELERIHAEFHMDIQPATSTGSSSSGVGSSSGSDSWASGLVSSSSGGTSDAGETSASESSTNGPASPHETSEPGGSSSTGSPPTVCGDGVVEGDEECDDGNVDDVDECDNACARAWTIFVSSGHDFNGAVSGLKGADSRCTNKAGNAGLPRWLSYRALLSDSTVSAAERLHHARGWYRLVNGLPVAHGWQALMNETLVNPVNVTEKSETLNTSVWTGTLPGGVAVPDAEHCDDWMSSSALMDGYIGSSPDVDSEWLHVIGESHNSAGCIEMISLYCIEQP
ncbi:MAG: DUF4215 domain-containing protein [Myxococcales bacterium]|nr:DUF4215 domain-containing protein [Myxococcales bacterium]